MQQLSESADHQHLHLPNRFAVIPTPIRLDADPAYTGRGVTIAFLDSGFYPHPDLTEPVNRIVAFKDLSAEMALLDAGVDPQSWQWHGTQTSVSAAGNGRMCDGAYRGIAPEASLVLVKASEKGRITEDNIARGIAWVIENRERYRIRILNISLGGDEDVPCTRSIIDQAAEEAVKKGIVVVVAAGNSGAEGRHSIPPANSPSVITVGGYDDNNVPGGARINLYNSNFGATADGSIKPEVIAPAMWVAAPILPGTAVYRRAEALSHLATRPDYELRTVAHELAQVAELPPALCDNGPDQIRSHVESQLRQDKVVAAHYQHVDGTSFAAPIVSSIVAQMLEANPKLSPGAVKNILISTADRLGDAPAIRQGFGVINARRAVQLAKSELHDFKTVGCTPPRISGGSLTFVFHDDSAETVSLVGRFNEWHPQQMAKGHDGLWQIEINAPAPGTYQYKFQVDGSRWIEDPSNGLKTQDEFRGFNSLLVIE